MKWSWNRWPQFYFLEGCQEENLSEGFLLGNILTANVNAWNLNDCTHIVSMMLSIYSYFPGLLPIGIGRLPDTTEIKNVEQNVNKSSSEN